MSQISEQLVRCPGCAHEQPATVFRSLNGDRLPAQVAKLRDGSFEQVRCARCAREFQPEHEMLFSQFDAGTWVVMSPPEQRPRYAEIEAHVAATVGRELAQAPAALLPQLQGCRPRLVFGQHFLAECIRVQDAGLDPVRVECAKLYSYLLQFGHLAALGPAELCFEGVLEGSWQFGVYRLASAERLATTFQSVATFQAVMPEPIELLAAAYPQIFTHPYLAAARFLFPPTS